MIKTTLSPAIEAAISSIYKSLDDMEQRIKEV